MTHTRCDDVVVIISFMVDLMARHHMTFTEPGNVCGQGLGYIATSIFMIITYKGVITLHQGQTTCVFTLVSADRDRNMKSRRKKETVLSKADLPIKQ